LKKVGEISEQLIEKLKLNITAGTPIYLGESNIEHMKKSHPEDYQKYESDIESIISKPDYIGINPKDKSLEYIKLYDGIAVNVKLAVRQSANGVYYARSLYARSSEKIKRFIAKEYLIKF